MTKRTLILTFALVLLASLAPAELGYRSIAATSTSQYFAVGAGSLTVVNNGASAGVVYVRIFWEGEDVTDSVGTQLTATTSNAEVKVGEAFEFHRDLSIKGIAVIAASTATVRLYYW